MISVLTYRFEPEEHDLLEAIRITVRTITMAGVGQHAKLVREAIEQWRADTNNPEQPIKEVTPNGEEEGREEGRQEGVLTTPKTPSREEEILYNQYARWATVAVATADKVLIIRRGKKAKELDEETPDAWPWETTSKTELGWNLPSGIQNIPLDLFMAWEKRALEVNPGLFGASANGAAKKKGTGLISVT